MANGIINKYKISFSNKVMHWPVTGKENVKVVDSNNEYLSVFLLEWKAEDITTFLLPEIDKVLNTSISELETGAERFTVIVDPINTVFYPDEVGENYPKIPTLEFKEILILWRNFLQQPPFNGQKLS